ncbi:IDEAL domain-containing protein [Bacillus licheniformis]|nr:IDEAL domain-containing protein [Bacillus licheniformis]
MGDWVKFSPSNFYRRNQKLFLKGYILELNGNYADVRAEDKKLYLGQKMADLIPCEDTPEYTQESLRTMINIALDTKDQNWFKELTSELERIQEVAD